MTNSIEYPETTFQNPVMPRTMHSEAGVIAYGFDASGRIVFTKSKVNGQVIERGKSKKAIRFVEF